jgi:hypothetical protein
MPTVLVLVLLAVIGSGPGALFSISTVCMQKGYRHWRAANFFHALLSSLMVAAVPRYHSQYWHGG